MKLLVIMRMGLALAIPQLIAGMLVGNLRQPQPSSGETAPLVDPPPLRPEAEVPKMVQAKMVRIGPNGEELVDDVGAWADELVNGAEPPVQDGGFTRPQLPALPGAPTIRRRSTTIPSPPPPVPVDAGFTVPATPGSSLDQASLGAACTPQCSWKCASQKCDQVCSPKCSPPRCQTRCTGMSTVGCEMKCGQSNCAVVFPARSCAKKDCPIAKTQCTQPLCQLVCPKGAQNCKDVCENPSCSWDCRAPEICPKPNCKMVCEAPKSCSTTNTYQALPPLKAGQVVVQNFVTPLSLAQHFGNSTLRIPVSVIQTTAVPGSTEVKLIHSTVSLPVVQA